MTNRVNPFHDLYLAERVGEERFVKLFSPMFVKHALPLFQPGNVILKGIQGSGKTMLLNLLKPEIRKAYHYSKESFPVPDEYNKYIGAGINLRKSGTIHFGQLLHRESSSQDVLGLVLLFADFVNYLIVDDLLQSIDLFYSTDDENLLMQVGLNTKRSKFDDFSKSLVADVCWFGALDGVSCYEMLKDELRQRIITYREFITLNREELPEEINRTKTTIGDPILKTAGYLHKHGILNPGTKVLVRIDQYEQLPTLDIFELNFGRLCQQLIHKALAARDSRVSYRIGTRQYAWPERPKIIGTTDLLEHKRDFSIIDIDEKLRRKENRRTWIFPRFAENIFKRRLDLDDITRLASRDLLLTVFGKGLAPSERAQRYVKQASSRSAIIKPEKDWPVKWVEFLINLAGKDPLSAKLGEAWCRQVRGKGKKEVIYNIPSEEPFPWDKKKYWKKERTEQALLQIASRNRQQLIWAGRDDLLGLSGGNILIFLFICQHIWDAWLRDTRAENETEEYFLPEVDFEIQSMGIIEASEEWLRKQQEGADVKRRQNFVNRIGAHFYKTLTEDHSMSNPGKNGFSIRLSDLEADQEIDKFLKVAVDYGDLYDAPHTSKTKGEKRRKFYLAPILCPAFKVPFTHTKEPEYLADTDKIREWIGFKPLSGTGKSDKNIRKVGIGDKEPIQGLLFPVGEKK